MISGEFRFISVQYLFVYVYFSCATFFITNSYKTSANYESLRFTLKLRNIQCWHTICAFVLGLQLGVGLYQCCIDHWCRAVL